jgi:predicted dehydrogenase
MHGEKPARRTAIVGTGHRGAGMWGKELLEGWRGQVDLVALCDINEARARTAAALIGTNAPIYTSYEQMFAEVRPDTVIVTARDDLHDAIIVKALEAGIHVISEKPLTTTAEKCRAILEAERRTGGRVDVTFNYRFAPTARRIKELLLSSSIGDVTSVDFHWYLDTAHGADYFRRWHAYERHSGSLFVHKASHHFDLLHWYLGSEPRSIYATAALRKYGRNGPFRGERCGVCPHARECNFFFDAAADPWLNALYIGPSEEDGYHRDACVFREDIDIPDTMAATILFQNGVQASYSLNAFMPIEGHHIAFNGTGGRIELRQYEKQPWDMPRHDEILLMRNFKPMERIIVPHAAGGHFGGDDRLREMLFGAGVDDPLGQRASAYAGAIAMLTGAAALRSSKEGRAVTLAEMGGLPENAL